MCGVNRRQPGGEREHAPPDAGNFPRYRLVGLSLGLDVDEDAALAIVPELSEIAVQKPFVHLVHAHRVLAGRLTAASENHGDGNDHEFDTFHGTTFIADFY
jgi:hypothetical protein